MKRHTCFSHLEDPGNRYTRWWFQRFFIYVLFVRGIPLLWLSIRNICFEFLSEFCPCSEAHESRRVLVARRVVVYHPAKWHHTKVTTCNNDIKFGVHWKLRLADHWRVFWRLHVRSYNPSKNKYMFFKCG